MILFNNETLWNSSEKGICMDSGIQISFGTEHRRRLSAQLPVGEFRARASALIAVCTLAVAISTTAKTALAEGAVMRLRLSFLEYFYVNCDQSVWDPVTITLEDWCVYGNDGYFEGVGCVDAATDCKVVWTANSVAADKSAAGWNRFYSCAFGRMPCMPYDFGPFYSPIEGILTSEQPFWTQIFSDTATGGFNARPETEVRLHNSGSGISGAFTYCREDFDASGDTNFADLSILLLAWGGGWGGWVPPRLDLDDSGEIDGGDMALILLSLGPCPSW